MLQIKVLGSGCANCKKLEEETRVVLDNLGLPYELTKVTGFAGIASHGVMYTPALVINEEVVVSGRVPKQSEISTWVMDAMADTEEAS